MRHRVKDLNSELELPLMTKQKCLVLLCSYLKIRNNGYTYTSVFKIKSLKPLNVSYDHLEDFLLNTKIP